MGVVDDLKSLVSIIRVEHRNKLNVWWSKRTMPVGVQAVAFKLFIFYIRNPYVPDERPERKLIRFHLSATSIIGFGALGKFFFMVGKGHERARQVARFWDDAFRWMNVLVSLHREGTFTETDTVHAACASMFLVMRDCNLRSKFVDPAVFALAFRLWRDDVCADDGDMGEASLPLGIVCSEMDLDTDNSRLLDAAVDAYEGMGSSGLTEGQLARIAIQRLDAELKRSPPRERAICYHIDILWLFTKSDDSCGNKGALAHDPKGLPSIVSALAQLAKADVVWINLTFSMTRAIQLLDSHLCTGNPDDADRMVLVLRNRPGLLIMMHHLSRRFDVLDDKSAALRILDRLIELLAIPSVLSSAVEELRCLPYQSESDSEPPSTSPRDDLTLVERIQAVRSAVSTREAKD